MTTYFYTLVGSLVTMDIDNPIADLRPSWGPLKGAVETKVGQLIAIVWMAAIVGAIIWLIMAIAGSAAARKSRHEGAAADAGASVAFPAGSLVILGVLPLIVSALL